MRQFLTRYDGGKEFLQLLFDGACQFHLFASREFVFLETSDDEKNRKMNQKCF
jgi:hypothetical protein